MTLGEDPTQPGSHPVPVSRTFNGKRKAAFLLALAKSGSIRGAAARVSITPTTVYDHAKKDRTFADAIERARGEWEQAQLDNIDTLANTGKVIERRNGSKIIEPGDWHASAWLLEHSPATRERYAGVLRQKVEIGGSDELPAIKVDQNIQVELGPDTMSRLEQVVMVLVKAGKLRLPEPGEMFIDGDAKDVTPGE